MVSLSKSRFTDAPLKTKLTLFTVSACLVTALLLSAAFIVNDIINIRKQLVDEITLTGKIIAERTSSRVAFMQADKAEQDLQALSYNPSLRAACIYLEDGTVFANYKASDNNDFTCPTPLHEAYYFADGFLNVYQPVTTPLGNAGSILIIADLRNLHSRVVNSVITVFVTFAFVMVLVYFVVGRLQKIISHPILSLLKTTRKVGHSRKFTARAAKFYNDEIGELTDSFNMMMDKIQDANDNLERKVARRTKALEREKVKAESANHAKSEFLRNMSHEFRTPLHAINSFSLYGIKESDNAKRTELHKYFTRIQSGTNRLLKLIDGVLSLARLESGQEAFFLGKGDLKQLLKAVVKEEQSLLLDKGISVIFDNQECDATAVFDNDRMFRVATNILGNAIRFTPEGSHITITFFEDQQVVKKGTKKETIDVVGFTIADQGCGIPEKELHSIFDKFVQSSRTNTGAGGTGLGLSIALNIVKGHHGEISVTNNADGGASFRVAIPKNLEAGQKIVTIDSKKL